VSVLITALYLIAKGGTCIFKREYTKTEVDEQLISGFLSAIENFARETFLDGLQEIKLQTGRTLIYGIWGEKGELLGAALADGADHPKLVEEMLRDIMARFHRRYGEELKKEAVDIAKFEEFRKEVDNLIISKVRARGVSTLAMGFVVGASLSMVLLFLLMPLAEAYKGLFPVISFMWTIPSLLAGYIAGNRKLGVTAALLSSITLLGFLRLASGMPLPLLLYASEIFVPSSILLGLLGGYVLERRALYPLRTGSTK
jgi:uncharacterized protein YneF (UPF0154 family)